MGKSLLLQQLGIIAHEAGRTVHLLQWDVARTNFETGALMAKYPEVNGVTHGVIRKAIGLWARAGVAQWHNQHPGREHMLIGEVPLVGNRLIELVQQRDDEVENLLTGEQSIFAVPVPSKEIRALIEAARQRSIADPQHERERNDAPPNVLRELWIELYRVGQELNFGSSPQLEQVATGDAGHRHSAPQSSTPLYDPTLYRAIYQQFLRHRRTITLPLDQRYDTSTHSVYTTSFEPAELAPTPVEVSAFVAQVELLYPDLGALEEELVRWYEL